MQIASEENKKGRILVLKWERGLRLEYGIYRREHKTLQAKLGKRFDQRPHIPHMCFVYVLSWF